MKTLNRAQVALRKLAKPDRVSALKYFYKTGPGQYGEGDEFIGISVPDNRSVAMKFLDASATELSQLFKSPIHEDRAMALHILVENYRSTKELKTKKAIVQFYLKHKKFVNNWDLVDMSAHKIVGHFCHLINNHTLLKKLSRSNVHWDKRIAMVSTFALIRNHEVDLTFAFAKIYLNETEDLMHKAAGWMLREAGKKNLKKLLAFIQVHGKKMPRTMLRYSIEKLKPDHRKKILLETK